jgi:uncharacterized repeat protein (TIGR01451 family)
MKRQFVTIVFTLISILGFTQNSSWAPTKGPYGGAYILTNGHNGKLYSQLYTNNKIVYRSTDGGMSWELTSGFANTPADKRIIGEAGNFYYKSTSGTWFRSFNEGQTWSSMGTIAHNISEIQETKTGTLIGWNTAQNIFYRSTNGAQSWQFVQQYSVSSSGSSNNIIPIISGVIIAQNSEGSTKNAYVSMDDGLTWSSSSLTNDYSLKCVSPSGAIFYVKGTDLYRRIVSPFQLIKVLGGLFNSNMTILPSGRLLVDILGELKYSDDDGFTWQNMPTNIPVGQLYTTTYLPDSSIFFNFKFNLYKSSDGGTTWKYSNNGMNNGLITNMKFISDSLYFATTPSGLFKTENAGSSWELIAEQFADQSAASFYSSFAFTNSGGVLSVHKNLLQYSVAANDSFVDITPPQAVVTKLSKVFVNPNNNQIFFAHDQGLSRSNDLGQTWTTNFNYKKCVDVLFHPSGRIVVSTGTNLLLSDNNGNSWTSIPSPFTPSYVKTGPLVVASNGTIFLYSVGHVNIMRSDDRGETWYLAGKWPFTSFPFSANLFFASNGHLYARGSNTYFSVNEGLTWQNIGCPDLSNCTTNFAALTPSQKLYLQNDDYDCYISKAPVSEGSYVEGHVRIDADADCSTDDAQEPLGNRNMEVIGDDVSFYTKTNAEGHYIFFLDTGQYELLIHHPNKIWWDDCQDTVAVDITEFYTRDTADFAALRLAFCPLMTVDVGIPQLRRCFNNQVYVSYCNQGTEPADSAWIDVFLDPYLSLVSSGQQHQDLGNNTIRFFLGDVQAEACGSFQLTVYLDCDSTILGQTHCISAHAYPDTLCVPVPDWSGAEIKATVTCQDSIIQLKLENDGDAPSQNLEYIIIEDDVMLFSGQQSYGIGQAITMDYPTNGSTWRIESEQEPGHPFSTLAIAFSEGCGGFGSTGFINQFNVNGTQPSWHRTCVENQGSYDPNDKQGFPLGAGAGNRINPGQDIDYLIRFQNTGTDTAFTVRIIDNLSALLDPASIRPGTSSHPYTWELKDEGTISFTFANVLLPDSNVNEAASHGFIQFNIKQRPNIPLGSVITNKAAIYFDFNAPVITNTTSHTVDEMPITSSVKNVHSKAATELDIWPNPCRESTRIRYLPRSSGQHYLKIYDMLGNLALQKVSKNADIELQTIVLRQGIYLAEIRDAHGNLLGSGRLVKH